MFFFVDADSYYSVTAPDVVSIAASVIGGIAYRSLMVQKLADVLRNANQKRSSDSEIDPADGKDDSDDEKPLELRKESRLSHFDIAEIFYEVNNKVAKVCKDPHILWRGETQTLEMRSTLTKMLNLTQIFHRPIQNK